MRITLSCFVCSGASKTRGSGKTNGKTNFEIPAKKHHTIPWTQIRRCKKRTKYCCYVTMLGYIVTLHCYVRLLRYRLWSAATLGVPGSKSRRLFSSRGRLSLLNISVAPGKCSFWQAPNLSNDVWYMVIIMQEDVTMWLCVPPGYSGNELMWLENSVQDFGPRELGLKSR